MKTTDFLAAMFCLLIGREHLQVSGHTYELKYKANVFDDQYIGCVDKLNDDVMPRILRQEKANPQFGEAWKMAAKVWNKMAPKLSVPEEFEDEHGIALLVFTNQIPEGNPIYQQFNGNLSAAGASLRDYMDNFHFKALHFYLTRALQILRPDCARSTVYRGTWDTFQASPLFRFGRFTSTSLNSTAAQSFGHASFFHITTCFGAQIGSFSFFPQEDEVLIPPTERFTYLMRKDSTYVLESTGQLCSYFNCAIMGGEKQTEVLCHSDSSNIKDLKSVKKSKVSVPLSELEERLGALERLAVRNHEEWDVYRESVSDLTQAVLREVESFSEWRRVVTVLYEDVEGLKVLCESNKHNKLSEVLQQTTTVMSLLLKQELQHQRSYGEEHEQKLIRAFSELEDLRELIWNAKIHLLDVEKDLITAGTRVTNVQNMNSNNMETVKTLQENIQLLQVSRDELQATVQNITYGASALLLIGIGVFTFRFARFAVQVSGV